jgi:hypothetical protein
MRGLFKGIVGIAKTKPVGTNFAPGLTSPLEISCNPLLPHRLTVLAVQQAIKDSKMFQTRVKIAGPANVGDALETAYAIADSLNEEQKAKVCFIFNEEKLDLSLAPSGSITSLPEFAVDENSLNGELGRQVFYLRRGVSAEEINRHERGLAAGFQALDACRSITKDLAAKFAAKTLRDAERSEIACAAAAMTKMENGKLSVKFDEEVLHIRVVAGVPYDVSAVATETRKKIAAEKLQRALKIDAEEILR